MEGSDCSASQSWLSTCGRTDLRGELGRIEEGYGFVAREHAELLLVCFVKQKIEGFALLAAQLDACARESSVAIVAEIRRLPSSMVSASVPSAALLGSRNRSRTFGSHLV